MTDWCSCNKLKEAEEKAAKWDAIVRCGECKHYDPEYEWEEWREAGFGYETCLEPPSCAFMNGLELPNPNGFCAWGERQDA